MCHILIYWWHIKVDYKNRLISRPPQVDLVPTRYIFFVNVPANLHKNLEQSMHFSETFQVPIVALNTNICA